MTWGTNHTWTVGEILTAALFNLWIRDQLAETAPAKVTTKGDLTPASGSGALVRKAVGTDGQVLMADAASTGGMKWAPVAGTIPGTAPVFPIVTPTANVDVVAWHPLGTALAITKSGTPYLYVYPFDTATGTFGAPSTPPVAPAGEPQGITWSPDGAYVAIVSQVSPYIQTYPWDGAALGAVVANPGSLPAGSGSSVAFSPNGSFIAVGHATTPFVSLYPWAAGVYGTKTTPGTPPPGETHSITWSPTSLSLVCGSASTPYITAYPISVGGVFGTLFRPAATAPGYAYSLAINAAGTYLGVGSSASPYVFVYPYTDSAIGVRVTDPVTLPPGQVYRAAWWEFGSTKVLICVNNTSAPYWTIYRWTGTAFAGVREWDFSNREVRGLAVITQHAPRIYQDQGLAVNPISGHVAVALQGSPYLYVMAPDAL